ncbi:MAG: helix-turn-helix transcriptional regulator, partial [Phycisphaerales bacterium]|nr:helix-turn-helix transcriptional regulator [Phycisphaerales bacterium]
GQTLIGLRIARGLTQRKLAKLLGVNETMVSRDERNEYHGITVDRAVRILDALDVKLVTHVEEIERSGK